MNERYRSSRSRHGFAVARRIATAGLSVVTALAGTMVVSALAATPAAAEVAPAPAAAAPALIPLPVSNIAGTGAFTLAPSARIVVTTTSADATAVATNLAAHLRPSTGYALPVLTGAAKDGDIALTLGDPGTLAGDTNHEGYQLTATKTGVELDAPTAHGLFNGLQTLRQLLPSWVESSVVQPGPWTIPVTTITDYPRYAYRGAMIDIARHYESPGQPSRPTSIRCRGTRSMCCTYI